MNRALLAWALYDLANTIFSLNVVSRYLPLLVINEMGGRDIEVSLAYSSSMILVAMSSPLLGALSDQSGRRLPYLGILTMGAVLGTAAMGLAGGKLSLLLLFAAANFCYQTALVFYDALLATVSTEENRGWASGLGVALGYVGALGGLYAVAPFAERWGRQAAFIPTAALFLFLALPCLLVVREGRAKAAAGRRWAVLKASWKQLSETLRHLSRYPGVARFLVARFLYTDAINTVILFMSVFAVAVGGFKSHEVTRLLALSTIFAVAGGFVQGFLVDRLGPKGPLVLALVLWTLTFALAAGAGSRAVMWIIGPLAGLGLGATWTADRVMMLKLAPEHLLGQFYGLYGMVGRFSAVVGPLVWGALVYAFEDWGVKAYKIAVTGLLIMLLAGLAMLGAVPRPRPAEVSPS